MFTPVNTSLGALLLFQGSSGLLLHNGRVFGISSLLSGSIFNPNHDNVPIIAGLVSSSLPIFLFAPSLIPDYPSGPTSWLSAASILGTGILLGWGTKHGRGCTSGHMLCGLSRLSVRSVIATAIFFTSAMLTANFLKGDDPFPACAGGAPCYVPTYPTLSELAFMLATIGLTALTNFVIVPRLLTRDKKSRSIFAYLAGLEFGLGLFISGMADPAKVLGFFAFLTAPSRFDPSLALIMLFGIGPSLATFFLAGPGRDYGRNCDDSDSDAAADRNGAATANGAAAAAAEAIELKRKPTLSEHWGLPTATVAEIDWRFVVGAATFGFAWGLSGTCPGPAILRTVMQPEWGLIAMAGYLLGNLF